MTKDQLIAKLNPSWSIYSYNDTIPNFILQWQFSGNSNDFSMYPHWNCDGYDDVIFSLKDKTLDDFDTTDEFKSKTTRLR
jgi:hypothetical protein